MKIRTVVIGLICAALSLQAGDKALAFGSQGMASRFSDSVKEHPYLWATGGAMVVGGLYYFTQTTRRGTN
jgi:hypothetical protein